MRRSTILVVFFMLGLSSPAWSGDTQFVQITSSLLGPSGLLFTQSANTLDSGDIEVGAAYIYEHSHTPRFTLQGVSTNLTLGVTKTSEISFQIPFVSEDAGGVSHQGLQDVDFSFKWRFLEADQEYNLPAFGVLLTYYLPGEADTRLVKSMGIKMLLVSSSEVELGKPYGILVGLYADAGLFLGDPGKRTGEKHIIADLGILLPLTESRRFQLLLEGNGKAKNNTPFEGSYFGATLGPRYVTEHLNVTGGVQHLFRRDKTTDDTNRFIFQTSYIF